jgi:D-alanyl-D-alanine carboxypeptidase (penicillin-binding protein 5/6)
VLHTPTDALALPDVKAASAILADLDEGQVLYAKDPDSERAIASLTKIMTGLLVFERSDPADIVTVAPDAVILGADTRGVSTLGLQAGETISVNDLLYALLLQSANDAALALADEVSGSEARFVKLMNARARTLGMRHTRFRSPNGLDDRGFSTPRDLVTLTRGAMAHPGFASIVATQFHTVPAPDGPDRELQNRNALLWLHPDATGAKTGFTSRAGYCIVATAKRDGRRLVAVILGASGDVFGQAAELLNYGFAAFTRHTFVTAGEPNGVVTLPGGSVPVETGADLEALIPTSALETIDEQVVIDPRAAYPPAPGERVASLKVTIPGLTVGRVPLMVSSVPPPPPIDDRSWWERAAAAVIDAIRSGMRAATG